MRKIWAVLVLAGCSATAEVDWPSEGPVAAPPLLPIDEVLGGPDNVTDARGAVLAAEVAALRARVGG